MPVKRIIEGGEHMLGLAESRLRAIKSIASKTGGYLKEIMQPEGVDGPTIQVSVTPTLDLIWIKGSEGVDVISGCISPGRLVDVTENPGTPEEKTYRAVQSFYPASIQNEIEKKGRSWRHEKRLGVESSYENKRIESSRILFAQTADVCPAQYTGKMVLAAQLALGQKDVVVEYQHSFTKTHGIYMAGKTPWLIEISGDIRAMKLSGSKNAKNKKLDKSIKTKFPMIPDGKAFPTGAKLDEAIAKGDVRILGSANSFYGACNPYFLDCGWAFNDDGDEAVNVGWSWPDDYKRGHLWKVSITGGESGPVAATCFQMESGYLFHPQSRTRLNFPTGRSNEVYTFNMKRVGFLQIPPGDSWQAPVYAFYVGNDLRVYRHKYFKDLYAAKAGGWIPFDPLEGQGLNIGSDTGGTPILRSQYGVDCSYSNGYDAGGAMDYSGPGLSDPILTPDEVYINRSLNVEVSTGAVRWVGSYQVARATMASVAICSETSGIKRSYKKDSSLSISPRNRTCVFIGTRELKMDGGYNVDKKYFLGTGIAHGTSYTDYFRQTDSSSSGSIDAGDSMFEFLAGPYMHSGIYLEGDAATHPVGPYMVSSSIINVAVIGTYATSATIASVGPGGSTSSPSPFPGVDIKIYKSMNGGLVKEAVASEQADAENFLKSFVLSPDEYENYLNLCSGRSAFLNSLYASKFPNGFSGEDLHKVGADGEDTGIWNFLQSWVGYS